MEKSKLNIVITVFIVFIINSLIIAQGEPSSPKEFLIGSFLPSSEDPEFTLYNYDQIHELGLNAVFQEAVKAIPGQMPNLEQLSGFTYVYASNDSGFGGDPGFNTVREENIDWISYFTNAKYTKWEAEGNPVFNDYVQIKNEFGTPYSEGNIHGIRSGLDANNIGKRLIKGPDYWQWPRYTFTNTANTTFITYKAVFRMKIDTPSELPLPVCEIYVTQSRFDKRTNTWRLRDTLHLENNPKVITLTTADLSTEYQDFVIPYRYQGFFNPPEYNINYNPPPTMSLTEFDEEESDGYYNEGSQVQFNVKWLGNADLFVDYIEVYDELIWKNWFIDFYQLMVNRIVDYDQTFKTQNPVFYSKLKYYYSLDEPHVIDPYEPLRKVQEILDSVGVEAVLLTHWYPGWDGKNELDGWDYTWPRYMQLAQPKKINFWYAPCVIDKNGTPTPRDFTLYWFHKNLQRAHRWLPGFYVSLQNFGIKEISTGNYISYMTPTPEELSAGTMLALAHGCEGILYEEYFSRGTWWPGYGPLLVENLVGFPPSYEPQPNWYKVKDITTRLKGILGKTLMSLSYVASSEDNGFLQLRRNVHEPTPETVTAYYLTLSTHTGENTPPTFNFHAGFFDSLSLPKSKYFFLTNLIVTDNRTVNIKVTDSGYGYENMRFRNIEPEFGFDTTFTTEFSTNYEFPAGEGYLFHVAPVIKYGGKIIYNETVSSNTILYDDLIIAEGATLTIQPGVTLQFKNNSRLIVKGTLNAVGNSSNKITFNFSEPDDNGIVVKQNGYVYIIHANIQNASTGIETESGINNLKIYYSNFTGCTDYGVNILGSASSVPHINYCQFTGSQTGINASGVNSVVIKQNTINNTQMGISLIQVLGEAHIIRNTLSSSLHLLHGILANSSAGYIRENTISGYSTGIIFFNSSLQVGMNLITDQLVNGMHVTSGSQPDLKARVVQIPGCNPPMYYALSGFNIIYDNGGYEASGRENDDGSEIYISNSYILMDIGCNEISDNRIAYPLGSPPDPRTTINLMNGRLVAGQEAIRARFNYWGQHPIYALEERFGNLIVEGYDQMANCIIPETPIGCPLVIYDLDDNEIDTIYAAVELIDEETEIEAFYSQGESLYRAGEYNQAVIIYNQIINLYGNEPESGVAYLRLYQIEKARQSDNTVFAQLKNFYDGKLPDIEDEVLYKIISQLSTLCLVAEGEYIPAMDVFANIILNYPDTDEALSAELDALTTSLIAGYNGNQMGKYSASGLVAKDSKEYNSKIKQLIWNKYGVENQGSGKESLIPEDYLLYQNYPNPFNPTTTIRYDLPKQSIVELTIFDILGRKVKTLVNNEMKQAGRYELIFNAGNLPSGVYFYRITAGDYTSTKKMMLIK